MKISIFRAFCLLALAVPSLAFGEDGIFNCDLTTFRQLAERRAKLKAAPELRNMPTSAKELDKANAKLNELAKPAMESESGALPELQRLQGKIHEAGAQKAAEVAETVPAKGDRAAAAVRKAFPEGKALERPAYTDGIYHGDKKPANIGLFAGNFAIPNGIDLDVVQRALKDGHLDEVYIFVDRKAPSFAERQKLAELAFGGNPKVKLIDPSEYRTQSFASALEDISEKNAGHTITSIGYADTLEKPYFRPAANVKFLIAGPLEDTEMLGGAVRARFGARMEKDPTLVRYLETDKVDLKSIRSAVAAGEKPDSIPAPVLERMTEKKASTAAERAAQDAKPKREKVAREPASVAEEPAVVAKSSVPQYDWTRSEPVMIRGKDGKEMPVTFAFDSELPHGEILKHLQGNETAIKELSDALGELKASGYFRLGEKIYGQGLTAKEIAESLQMSEKQLRGFGNIRKGVDKNKERFLLTDLSPKNFNTMMNGILSPIGHRAEGFPQSLLADADSAKLFMKKYRDIATKVFRDKPDVFDAGIDANVVEVRHASFESSPSKFHEIVAKDLNESFPGSNTHLHSGFPAAAISQAEMQGVGRSIESRIILQMAAAAPEAVHPLYSTSYSSLREGEWGAKRGGGVIRMNYNKFETPVRSHDLEIRDYKDLNDGFFTLGLAANLGSNHELLRTVPNFKNVKIDDPFTSNLNGALKYVGTLMKENEDPALQKIGHQLYAFGDKIEEAGKITPEMRKDVFEYLDKNRVTDLLDERVYLKPRTGMAGAFSQWSAEEVKAIKNPITSSNDRAAAVQAIRSLQDSAVTRISDLMVDVRSSSTMPYWEKEALMKSLTKNVFDQANYLDRAESAAKQKFEEAKRQHVDPFEYLKLSKDLETATRAKTRFNAAAYEPMYSARAALASLDPVGEVNKRAEFLAHDIERTFRDSRGGPLQVASDPAMKKALVAGVSAAEAIRYPAFAKKEDLVAKLAADPSYFSKRGLSPKALAELQLPKDVHSMTDAEFQKISGVFWREKAAAFENAYKAATPESHHSLARSFAQLCLAGANCGDVEQGAALAKLAALADDAGKPGKTALNADGSRSFMVGGKEIRLPPTASSSLAAAIESNKKIILTIGDVEGTHTFLDAYVRDGMMKMGTIKSGPLSFEGYVFTDAAKMLAQNGKLEVQLMGDLINGPYTMRFLKNIQFWNEEFLHINPEMRGPKVVAVLGNHDTAKIRYNSFTNDPEVRKAYLARLNGAPDTAVGRVKNFYNEIGIPWAFTNLRDEFKPFLAERVGKMKVTDKRLNELSEMVAANWFEGATTKPGGDLLEHIMSEHSSLLHLSEGGGDDARGAVIYSHSGVTPVNFGKTGTTAPEADKLGTWETALKETQRLLGEQVVEHHLTALFSPGKQAADRASLHVSPEAYAKLDPHFQRELEHAALKDPVIQDFLGKIKAGKPGDILYNPNYDTILNLLTDSKYGTVVAKKEQLANLPSGMRETLEKRYPSIKAFFAKLEKDGAASYGVNSPSRSSLTYGNRFMDDGPPGASDVPGHVMTKLARSTPPADFMDKMKAQGAKLFAVGHTPVPVPVLVRTPDGPALFYSDTTFMPWKKPVNYIHEDGSLHSTSFAAVDGRGIRIETEYVPGKMGDSPVGKIHDEAVGPYNVVGKAYDENTGEYLGYALTNQNVADFKPNVILRKESELADARFATSIPSREEAAANRDVALMQHALSGGQVFGVKSEFNGEANAIKSIKDYKAEDEAKAFLAAEVAKGKKVSWIAGGADFAAVNSGDSDAILNYWRDYYRSPDYHANGTHPGHVRIYGGTNKGFELAERTAYQEALAGKLGAPAKAVAERSSYVGRASFDSQLADYLHPSDWDMSRDHLLIPSEEVARANHETWDTAFASMDDLFTYAAEKARESKAPMPEVILGGGGGVVKRGGAKLLDQLSAQGTHPTFRVSLLEGVGASGALLKDAKPELREAGLVKGYSFSANSNATPAWMDLTRTQKTDELARAVAERKPEEHSFIKQAPLLGYRIKSSDLKDVPEAIRVHMGEVDKTNYTKEYLEKKIGSLIALQFDKGKTDFYVIGKDALDAKYGPSTLADVKAKNAQYYEGLKGVLPDIVGKEDPNLVPVMNIVPSKMVKMSDLGYPIDKEITIESPWQLQTKPAGRDAYLTLDVKKQKYYMVNTDDAGLPLSYVAADSVKSDGWKSPISAKTERMANVQAIRSMADGMFDSANDLVADVRRTTLSQREQEKLATGFKYLYDDAQENKRQLGGFLSNVQYAKDHAMGDHEIAERITEARNVRLSGEQKDMFHYKAFYTSRALVADALPGDPAAARANYLAGDIERTFKLAPGAVKNDPAMQKALTDAVRAAEEIKYPAFPKKDDAMELVNNFRKDPRLDALSKDLQAKIGMMTPIIGLSDAQFRTINDTVWKAKTKAFEDAYKASAPAGRASLAGDFARLCLAGANCGRARKDIELVKVADAHEPAHYDWKRSEPVTIRGKDGKELPVTLAFDSELPHAEILKHLAGNEAAMKELTKAIGELKAPGNWFLGKKIYEAGLTAKEIAEALQMSEKQLRGFGNIRKGVDKNKERFLLTDLSPKNFNTMMNGILSPIGRNAKGFPQKLLADETSAKKFMEKYRDIATRVFKDKPDVFDPGVDQNVVEVRHASFESSPSKFHDTITKDLNENFPGANTHLHAGFPSEALSRPEMQGVGRSIESRIILQMAAAAPEAVHPLYATTYSSLREGEMGANRGGGIIRMNYDQFKTPALSHDLEIRDYRDMKDGFFTLGLAVNLASNRESLRLVPDFKNAIVKDLYTSNLNGALKYVGSLMRDNEDPAIQKIGHQLVAFGDDIERAREITPKMRKDVFEYLDENKVTDLLDERIFLKPKSDAIAQAAPGRAPASIAIPSAHGDRVYAGHVPDEESRRIAAQTAEIQAQIDKLQQEKKAALAAKTPFSLDDEKKIDDLEAKIAAERQPIVRAAVMELRTDLAVRPVQFTKQQVGEIRALAQAKEGFSPEKLMDALAGTGDPRLKLWYGPTADSGTELGSVRAHMAIVEQQYEKFKKGFGLEAVKMPGKGAPSADEFMRVFLAQHDLAKSEAVALGDKAAQHEFIAPVMDSIMRAMGYPLETREVAKALVSNDTFGPLLKNTYFAKTAEEKAKIFADAEKGLRSEYAKLSGTLGAGAKSLPPSDYVKLLSAFYQSDSSSYPFLLNNVFNGGDVASRGAFLQVRDPVYGKLLEKFGVSYGDLVKAGEKGPRRLSVAFDIDGNFASKIAETDPVPPGFKAYHADGNRYLVPDTFVQKVESLIDPAKNKGVPVDVYVFSAGTPQRNLELSSQIQVHKPDGTVSTLRDVSARGADGQPIVLTRKDLEYVKERMGLEKPGFEADMTQLLADSRISRFDPFQSAAMVKDLTHITPDLSRVVLVDDNVLFSGINDQAGNLIRSVAMRGEPGLNAKDWSGRLSALIDRAVSNVAEGRDARDGLMARQFRVIRQQDGSLGFRYEVARSKAESNRNVVGRVTRGPLDPAFRSETNPGGAVRALAEANNVWRPAASEQAKLDKLNEVLRANSQPEMTMRELRSNLYESFLQDRLAVTGDSLDARAKQLLDDVAKAGPSLKLGAAPAGEQRAVKAALAAAQLAAGGTRVFEVSREQSAAGRRAFVDTYLANTGGGQALRARAVALADLCHAGGMCASVLDVEGSELRAFYHEPPVLAGTDSFSRTVGIHANDVVNGRTVYSARAMENLRRTRPALARALDVNEAYGEALAGKRVGFLKGTVSAADYAAAERRYGVASIPVLRTDRAGALAQQEDFLARRAARARLDNDPTLAARLDAERASVGAAMLGEQAKAARATAGDAKKSRRSAVQSIENGDFYRAYADRMGVSFAEAVNDPEQAARLTAMVENDAAQAAAAAREARAHLEAQVTAKLGNSALAQDLVDLHADGAAPAELVKRHPERWNEALVKSCVETKLCEPTLEEHVADPAATSLTARRVIAEASLRYADPATVTEASLLMAPPLGSSADVVKDLRAARTELASEVDRLAKLPGAKAAEDDTRGALKLVDERLQAADRDGKLLADSRSATTNEMKLANQAAEATKRFVAQATDEALGKLGIKDLPKGEGRYEAFKAKVGTMAEVDAAGVISAAREFAAKEHSDFAEAVKKADGSDLPKLTRALLHNNDLANSVGKDAKTTAAVLRDAKVSATDQALAGAVGAVKAAPTKAEKKAVAVAETKKLADETKRLVGVDRAPASLDEGVAKLAGVKAEDQAALRTALDTVFRARGADQAKQDLAHMQALAVNADLFETYRMAYVSAAKELPKAKGGWDEAWLGGVKQMLRDSGYDNLDKTELDKLARKTAVCLK